jgi:hypothetical protein
MEASRKGFAIESFMLDWRVTKMTCVSSEFQRTPLSVHIQLPYLHSIILREMSSIESLTEIRADKSFPAGGWIGQRCFV